MIRYLPRYTPEQFRRHEVRPGLTGWTQTNGRNALSWDQKFQFDVWYVDHLSLWLDIKIIARTFWLVLRRANVNAEGHATMPEFMGSAAKSGSARADELFGASVLSRRTLRVKIEPTARRGRSHTMTIRHAPFQTRWQPHDFIPGWPSSKN